MVCQVSAFTVTETEIVDQQEKKNVAGLHSVSRQTKAEQGWLRLSWTVRFCSPVVTEAVTGNLINKMVHFVDKIQF